MVVNRQWLSWHESCLPQAAAWLIDHYAHDGVCDLQRIDCVLPGGRAGRVLLTELLGACRARGCRLHPPRICTPGPMVDAVLEHVDLPSAIASDLESHMAWMLALRELPADVLAPLLPVRPAADDLRSWDELSRTLAQLYESLAGELKTFDDAAAAAERMGMPDEARRWQAMASARERHREALLRVRLIDRHDARQVRLDAARSMPADMSSRTVILIGVSDLNALQRAVLQLPGLDVVALVHAPESESQSFDEFGAVDERAWLQRAIEISDDVIRVVERPSDQAQAILQDLAELGDAYSTSNVTIGLGDAELFGQLDVESRWAGVMVHNPAGQSLSKSAPYRLLEAAVDWMSDRRFEHLASLLRHPDVERWVLRTARITTTSAGTAGHASNEQEEIESASIEWLTLLDRYFAEHLQGHLTGDWLGDSRVRMKLKAVHDAIERLIQPLCRNAGRALLGAWCQPVLDVLASAYAIERRHDTGAHSMGDHPDVNSIDAVLMMRDSIGAIAAIAPALQPEVDAVSAVRMILQMIGEVNVAVERAPDALEALGWLELHLDTAPVLEIIGFNEGAIPEAIVGHSFLPDALRTALGITNNARRYARDAYLLQAIVNSRQHLRLVVGRSSAQGDPLLPSRLLLACDDRALVQRVMRFTEDRSSRPQEAPIGLSLPRDRAASRFVIPELPQLQPPAFMRVTEFRQFLQCPYRYALKRLLGLEGYDDITAELDPLAFGTLAHETLALLTPANAVASSTDAGAIFDELCGHLHALVESRFGARPMPAVQVQLARLEQRLRSFAEFQAQQNREGWRIVHNELSFTGDEVMIDVPGEQPMPLRGTIDRIDHHPASDRWRVIDFKTSESGKSPHKSHHDPDKLPDDPAELRWIDLQLPLYHLLVTRGRLGLPAGQIELGYVVLPKRAHSVRWLGAEWTAEHLAHALETAREVIRRIRRGEYGVDMMKRDLDADWDEFSRICQTSAFKAEADDDESEEAAA